MCRLTSFQPLAAAVLSLTSLLASLYVGGPASASSRPKTDASIPSLTQPSFDYVFPSGLRVIVQPDDTQAVVSVAAVHDRGSSDEVPGEEGLAHLVEHLWFRSLQGQTNTHGALTQMGCWYNASTRHDLTDYISSCPASSLETLLQLESRRLTEPLAGVSEDVFETEREIVRNELRTRFENRIWAAQPFVLDMLFPEGHPYARSVIGTHESLSSTSLAAARQFAAGYRPEDTTIVINGDIELSRIPGVLFEHMDLSLFHPDLTPEHLARWPLGTVDEPDPDNPEHWFVWPTDPNQPGQRLETHRARRRAPATAPPPPPPVRTAAEQHRAAVSRPLTVIAWSLPGAIGPQGAQFDRIGLQVSAGMVKALPKSQLSFAACTVSAERSASILYCFFEPEAEADRDRMVKGALRWVSDSWAPSVRKPNLINENRNRMRRIHSEVRKFEQIAGTSKSRAMRVAHHAHLTGRPSLFGDALIGILEHQDADDRALAHKWIRPERAVVVHLDPLPQAELMAQSAGIAQGEGHAPIMDIDSALLVPEMIAASTVVPDTSRLVSRTLDTGLTVVAMRHGSLPWVRMSLEFGEVGHDSLLREAAGSVGRLRRESVLEYAGAWTRTKISALEMYLPADRLDSGLWLLADANQNRWVNPFDAAKWTDIKEQQLLQLVTASAWWAESHATRTLFPASDVFVQRDFDTYADIEISRGDLRRYLDQRYQPGNALLVVVGDIEPELAVELAEEHFGRWKGEPVDPTAPPTVSRRAAQATVVLDEPRATQTTVSMHCALPQIQVADTTALKVMRNLLESRLTDALRHKRGATYFVVAQLELASGGGVRLRVESLVQNDAAADTVTVMREAIDSLASGDITASELLLASYAFGQQNVLRFQSTSSMVSLLAGTWRDGQSFDTIDDLPEQLAGLTADTVAARLEGCNAHSVVNLAGPAELLKAQLAAAGMEAEVFDWRAAALAVLDERDSTAAERFREQQAQ